MLEVKPQSKQTRNSFGNSKLQMTSFPSKQVSTSRLKKLDTGIFVQHVIHTDVLASRIK